MSTDFLRGIGVRQQTFKRPLTMLLAALCLAHFLRRETASVLTSEGVGGLHDFVSIPRGAEEVLIASTPTPPAEPERWGLLSRSKEFIDSAGTLVVMFKV